MYATRLDKYELTKIGQEEQGKQRRLACETFARECAESKVDPAHPRKNSLLFEEAFKDLGFQDFMRQIITCMESFDETLYNKTVCSRVIHEAWAMELVCGIKLGEWATGNLALEGLCEDSSGRFREFTQKIANRVCQADKAKDVERKRQGNGTSAQQGARSPPPVGDMSICI